MIDYTLKKNPRARRLSLRVLPSGEVVVTGPPLTPRRLADQLVADHEDWIKRQQTSHASRQPRHGENYQLFGKNYRLEFGYDPQLASGWHCQGERLLYNNSRYLLTPKTDPDLTPVELASLEKFAKQTFSTYLQTRLPQLHERMHIPTPVGRVTLKQQATRWGSCSSQHNLNFNWHLVHFEPAVIDYVLIHELAHLVHMDHSAAFWALVAKYDGHYQLHRRLLNH